MTLAVQKQLRHLFTVISGATPNSGNADYWDGDILWSTPEDISSLDGYWLRDTRRKITRAGYKSCGTTTAPPCSIALTKRAPIGQVALLADEACSNQGCFLLIPRNETDTRFYYYWLSVQTDYLQILGRGSTFMELSTDELKSLNISHPSLQFQRTIADYLDCETARLDALVAAKERVLGLLAEKRRALITRAVTRGLDSDTPLRDSGIPWLGKIPAHWKTSKFTWSIFITEGQVDPEIEPYVNMPLIAPNHIEPETGRLLFTETAADQGAISGKYLCQRGDVIYSKIRPALRKATIAVEQCLCSADMYPLRSREDLRPEFVLFILLSDPFSTWAVLESNRVAMPKINRESLGGIRIPLPPSDEQCTIIEYIAEQVAKLDNVRASTEHTIALLKERRGALIAAAVKGQIKVGSAA